MRIQGRTAIVTGASRGIGRAVALDLARRGAKVALVARGGDALEKAAAVADAQVGTAKAFSCDVASAAQVEAAHAAICRWAGPPDILVNVAGVAVWKPFAEITEAEHRAMMAVNYWGTFEWIRRCLPAMRASDRGSIVNVAAGSGLFALPVTSGFSASKFAVVGLSQALHRELLGTGVSVSLVNPGSVKTEFWNERDTPVGTIPPLVRYAPKLSPAAIARTVRGCIRFGFAVRTVPVFVNLLAKANGLWLRLGDLLLWRWFLPAAVLLVLARVLLGILGS